MAAQAQGVLSGSRPTQPVMIGWNVAKHNEAALIARVLRGDLAAFEGLIRPYEARIYQMVLRVTQNPSDAADVYQDALLAAFQKLASFRGAAAFGTWLYRIAANFALMRRRAAARNPVILEEDLPQFNWMGMHARPVCDCWAESAEAPASRAELRRVLGNALRTLAEIDRAIVWLKDAEGFSHEDIATVTGMTVVAARTRLHRARLSLRAQLEHHVGGRG